MNTVKKPLTPNLPRQRRRDVVENDQFAGFAKRIIRAHGRRVATGDVEALRDLIALSSVIDDAIGEAVIGLRAFGYSWAEIGSRLGITRQAAQQRWGGDKP
ncbi:hypothetical protein ACFYP0_23085 [Micromonospora arida]|uniref:hypothetical protein n=1 Tax=Micromonospora TaxID=1873 RepID=UPI0036AFE514